MSKSQKTGNWVLHSDKRNVIKYMYICRYLSWKPEIFFFKNLIRNVETTYQISVLFLFGQTDNFMVTESNYHLIKMKTSLSEKGHNLILKTLDLYSKTYTCTQKLIFILKNLYLYSKVGTIETKVKLSASS